MNGQHVWPAIVAIGFGALAVGVFLWIFARYFDTDELMK